MENFVERIIELCKEKGIKVSTLEKDLGYGNGYLNPKKVSDMKAGRLIDILDYLGVSLEEFFNIGSPQTQAIQTALTQIKRASPEVYEDIINKWTQIPTESDERAAELNALKNDPDFLALMDAYKKMTPQQVRVMKSFMKSMTEEENYAD